MRTKGLLAALALAALLAVPSTTMAMSQFEKDRHALRKKVPYEPIPHYIVECESGGVLHRQQVGGPAGGRYQIEPGTWSSHIVYVKSRVIQLAGGDRGPRWSGRLMQDIVALKILHISGLDQWSCA